MSSITDRRGQRGQVLLIVAFGMIGILAIAALVFDVGRDLLERRRQQNTVDSAALAGARYLVTPACKAGNTSAACPEAVAAARDLASRNGYVDGVNGVSVRVNIPPNAESRFAGLPGHIQVVVDTSLPSFFAGVIGINNHRVATLAVAGNTSSYSVPFGLLSLNDHSCGAGNIGGNGSITINADVMVNSDCTTSGALSFDGRNATIDNPFGNCNSVGTYKVNPPAAEGVTVNCGSFNSPVTVQPDPLLGLSPPLIAAIDNPPDPPIITGSGSNAIPNGCPGSSNPSSATNFAGCDINFNRAKVVRIFPGVYWGGLALRETSQELTVYMEPGIYYMAGGGFEVSGNIVVRSVAPGGTTYDSGVMIFNGDAPNGKCATVGGNACIKAIDFATDALSDVDLDALEAPGSPYHHLLIYQDRDASAQPAMSTEGNATMTLEGTIYLPEANFNYHGNGVGEVLQAQIICDEFTVTGGGALSILYDPGDNVQLKGVGLVQ